MANEPDPLAPNRLRFEPSTSIAKMAREDDRDTVDVLGDAQTRMIGLSGADTEEALGDALAVVLKDSEEASLRQDNVAGVPFGNFDRLNLHTGGMEGGDLIEIASRPSVGKTSIALNIAWDLAEKGEFNVLFFSAEMKKKALAVF